jgi:photosystem II stability/assembly factor-like uncharacterized protein
MNWRKCETKRVEIPFHNPHTKHDIGGANIVNKLFHILIIWSAFAVQNHVQAQWVAQNSGTNDELDGVFFTDANTGYAVGMDTTSFRGLVLKTTNGGGTWTPLSVSCMIPRSPFFTDQYNGYVAAYDTVLKTTDAGASWSKYPINLGLVLFGMHFYNSAIGYAAGMQFPPSANAAILKTTNAGVTWTSQSISPPARYHTNSLYCTSADTCYLAGGYALKTTNGGITWDRMSTPSIADWSSVFFTSATNGVIVGGSNSSGSIIRTTDGGASWNTVYSAPAFLSSVYFIDASTGYAVGGGGIILRTTDEGATWDPQTSPPTHELNWVHFPLANIGYAVGNSGTIVKYNGPASVSNDQNSLPMLFVLGQNYPNPFNPSTTIKFELPRVSHVSLTVYDILGRQVSVLVNERREAGVHEVKFDGSNLASGVYFYRLQAGTFVETKKLLLLQ